jgi:hypothetical protein
MLTGFNGSGSGLTEGGLSALSELKAKANAVPNAAVLAITSFRKALKFLPLGLTLSLTKSSIT